MGTRRNRCVIHRSFSHTECNTATCLSTSPVPEKRMIQAPSHRTFSRDGRTMGIPSGSRRFRSRPDQSVAHLWVGVEAAWLAQIGFALVAALGHEHARIVGLEFVGGSPNLFDRTNPPLVRWTISPVRGLQIASGARSGHVFVCGHGPGSAVNRDQDSKPRPSGYEPESGVSPDLGRCAKCLFLKPKRRDLM